jgi:hypothetical protein
LSQYANIYIYLCMIWKELLLLQVYPEKGSRILLCTIGNYLR